MNFPFFKKQNTSFDVRNEYITNGLALAKHYLLVCAQKPHGLDIRLENLLTKVEKLEELYSESCPRPHFVYQTVNFIGIGLEAGTNISTIDFHSFLDEEVSIREVSYYTHAQKKLLQDYFIEKKELPSTDPFLLNKNN